MKLPFRIVLFLASVVVIAAGVWHVAVRMPEFGAHPLPYGDAINGRATAERHITNMVTAVNFDYRGLDTLGEEFMLLCAVTGAVVLLRGSRGEGLSAQPGVAPGRPLVPRADSTVLVARILAPLVVVFGIYVVLHVTVTPGGGFQGGVIIASGVLLVFLGEGYRGWRKIVRSRVLAAIEAGGAAIFALAGFASMLTGAAFLQNVLPLGQPKQMLSGGLMLVENAGVVLAVAGGFLELFLEFLEETRAVEGDET